MVGAWGVARVLARGDGVGSTPSSGRRLAGDLVAAGARRRSAWPACSTRPSSATRAGSSIPSPPIRRTCRGRRPPPGTSTRGTTTSGSCCAACPDDGPFWTEAAILGLGLVGLVAILARGNPRRGASGPLVFLAAYAVLIVAAYSAIPYKTPWCVIGFLDACAVVAGVGAASSIARPGSPLGRSAVSAAVAAVVIHLGWLAWSASFPFRLGSAKPLRLCAHGHRRLRDRAACRDPRPRRSDGSWPCRSR